MAGLGTGERTYEAAALGGDLHRRAVLLLAALLAAFLGLAPRAEAFVYWSHYFGINRGGLDGTIINDPLIAEYGETSSRSSGVAVDAEHIYWGRPSSGAVPSVASSIGRANLDGTNIDRSFIEPPGLVSPCGVAVNASHIYWVDYAFLGGGTIGRANLDGTDVELDFIPDANPTCDIAVDEQHVYWAGGGLGNIGRASVNGTNADNDFISSGAQAFGVAVDAEHIYWARLAGTEAAIETYISRADLDGTDVDEDFITLPGIHDDVAVDERHVYWGGSPIGRANLDGTGVNDHFISLASSSANALAVDALPPNDFSLGKAKKNERKGIAKLTVSVPGPGNLDLAKTMKVKADDESAEVAGTEKLLLKANGKAGKKLNANGELTVNAKVTFTPDGGEPYTKSKKIKLVKR